MSAARWAVVAGMIVIVAALLVLDRPWNRALAARDGPPREADGSSATSVIESVRQPRGARTEQALPVVPAPMRQPTAVADRLPVEAGLLAERELHADRVARALSGDAFDLLLDAMDADLRRNAGAQALTDAYAEAIAAQLGDGEVLLDGIACGLRLCAVRLVGPGAPEPWTAWAERFDKDPATPSYARVERDVELEAGLRERRLVFTTDPSSPGLTISAF